MAIWTSRPSVSAPRAIGEEIEALLDHVDRVPDLVAAAQRSPVSTGPVEVITSISRETGVPVDATRKIFNVLENIRNLSEEFGTVAKTIDEIAQALPEKTSSRLLAAASDIGSLVEAYATDNGVRLSYKAQRLTYLRENIYQEAEVITDTRPVFDTSAGKVEEYLITHSLVVTYFRQGRIENIHLVLDAADVLKLRRALDRAIIKANTLRSELGDRARILRDDDATT